MSFFLYGHRSRWVGICAFLAVALFILAALRNGLSKDPLTSTDPAEHGYLRVPSPMRYDDDSLDQPLQDPELSFFGTPPEPSTSHFHVVISHFEVGPRLHGLSILFASLLLQHVILN